MSWLESKFPTEADRREFEAERLIQSVTSALNAALADHGISQTMVAQRLGKSAAYVSQVLSGRRNCTLRTLADIAWACDRRLTVDTSVLQLSLSLSDEARVTSTLIPLRRFNYTGSVGSNQEASATSPSDVVEEVAA